MQNNIEKLPIDSVGETLPSSNKFLSGSFDENEYRNTPVFTRDILNSLHIHLSFINVYQTHGGKNSERKYYIISYCERCFDMVMDMDSYRRYIFYPDMFPDIEIKNQL